MNNQKYQVGDKVVCNWKGKIFDGDIIQCKWTGKASLAINPESIGWSKDDCRDGVAIFNIRYYHDGAKCALGHTNGIWKKPIIIVGIVE